MENTGVKKKHGDGYRTVYPEQVKLGEQMRIGDQMMLVEKTKYSSSAISRMFSGELKMEPEIFSLATLIIANRAELESIDISQLTNNN